MYKRIWLDNGPRLALEQGRQQLRQGRGGRLDVLQDLVQGDFRGRRASVTLVDGGCYGATQGPRLETKAEIARMRRDGCDLVGMTGMPEAGLAREMGLDYACLALVANWAAGCGAEGSAPAAEITLEEVLENVEAATATLPQLLAALLAG